MAMKSSPQGKRYSADRDLDEGDGRYTLLATEPGCDDIDKIETVMHSSRPLSNHNMVNTSDKKPIQSHR